MALDFKDFINEIPDNIVCEAWDFPSIIFPNKQIHSIQSENFDHYRSNCYGILLLFTLDNHKSWRKILVNAIESAQKKIIIIKNTTYRNNDDIDFLFRIYNIHYTWKVFQNNIVLIGTKLPIPNFPKIRRTAVCTCIYGKYDDLHPIPEHNRNDVDFICFTDNPMMPKDRGWMIDTIPYHEHDKFMEINGRISIEKSKGNENHPNIVAKYYKMCTGRIPRLQIYDRILYIDGSLQILDLSILDDFNDKECVVYQHTDRNTVQSEADQSNLWKRYVNQPVKEQVASYFEEGFEDECLLLAGFSLRPNNDFYNRMFAYWFYETQKWTDLCQVSMPFIFWLFDKKPFINQDSLFKNTYTVFHHHKYNY